MNTAILFILCLVASIQCNPLFSEIGEDIDQTLHIQDNGKYYEEVGKSLGKTLDKVEYHVEETLEKEFDNLEKESQNINEDLLGTETKTLPQKITAILAKIAASIIITGYKLLESIQDFEKFHD